MPVHCAQCGQPNADAANFCQHCGSSLRDVQETSEPATAAFRIDDDTGELVPVDLADVTARGPVLMIRSGGGRAGESFPVAGERMTIGRRPDSDVFLDDVTVSRDHAVLMHRGEDWYLDDCGSLNGTYVNRSRIESTRLEGSDEVQIGKYKLIFRAR
ncbi:MAG: FHA domain-containing protein [Solirubrobacteraceae bacterium]